LSGYRLYLLRLGPKGLLSEDTQTFTKPPHGWARDFLSIHGRYRRDGQPPTHCGSWPHLETCTCRSKCNRYSGQV